MSAALQRIQQLAQATENVGLDMSQTSKGGGGRRLLPQGNALGRFVLYREFGNQPREFGGQAKTPAMEIRLGFLLWGKGDPQGPDTPENLYHRVDNGEILPGFIESYGMSLGNNEKSKTKIAFDKMNYKGTAKRFIELIGDTYIIPIKVKQPTKPNGKPRNEIDWATIQPARDPLTATPYPVPEAADEDYKVFLWDAPTKEDWDAMFIEGQNEKGESKNWMQAQCLKALNFPGSLLEQLLLSLHGGALPDLGLVEGNDDEPEDAPAAPEAAAPAVPAVPAAVPSVPASNPIADVTGQQLQAQVTAPAVPAVPSVPSVPSIPSIPQVG